MKKQTIYDRIILARRRAKQTVTLTGIAKDLKINHSAVAKWKRGEGVKQANIIRLALTTGVCVEWLYTGREPERPPSKDTLALIAELEALDPDSREAVLSFARFRGKGSKGT